MRTLFVFAIALALFTIGLSGQEIISFDSRFYLFAMEMRRYGVSWFPTTYGQLYPDYTSASTILIYWSSLLFGGLNKFTAVLPSAIAAALTVVVTEKIGALEDEKIGFYALFTLIGTLAFFKSARSIALDMYPTLLTACCFYVVHYASKHNMPERIKWIYPLLALGFIFRGPIGLVIPTGVVCSYFLVERNNKNFFLAGVTAFTILIIGMFALMLIAQHAGGDGFEHEVWRMQFAGRMQDAIAPLYFYFMDSFVSYALSFPFALVLMIGVLYASLTRKFAAKEYKFLLLLSAWVLVILFGMSIPADKKVRYVLPIAPALALLSASVFARISGRWYFAMLHRIAVFFYLILPGLFAISAAYFWQLARNKGLQEAFPFLPMLVFFLVIQAASLYFYFSESHAKPHYVSWTLFFGTLCFVAANLFLIEPIELYVDRTRDFVQAVESLRLRNHARLVFYREQTDRLPIKYLIYMNVNDKPQFAANETELAKVRAPAVIVTHAEYFESLPDAVQKQYRIIAAGKIGHVNVIVFDTGR